MKGIVLEIRNRTAAVLREDGVIVKTRQKCAVGDTIELSAEKIRFPSVRSVAAAAAAVIVIGGGSGIYTYENVMACSYVSLDINPSLELVLNRQNRVIKVNACDDEAESVVEAIKEQNIKNMKVDDALETAYDVLKENGYIAEDDENYILFNVSSDEKKRTETLTGKIETLFSEKEGALAVTTESSLDDRDKARELGISTGKYHEIRMIEESANPDSVNLDAKTVGRYSDMTVRECMEEAGQIPRRETAGNPADPASFAQPSEEVPKDSGAVQQPVDGTQMPDGTVQQPVGGTQMPDGTIQQPRRMQIPRSTQKVCSRLPRQRSRRYNRRMAHKETQIRQTLNGICRLIRTAPEPDRVRRLYRTNLQCSRVQEQCRGIPERALRQRRRNPDRVIRDSRKDRGRFSVFFFSYPVSLKKA